MDLTLGYGDLIILFQHAPQALFCLSRSYTYVLAMLNDLAVLSPSGFVLRL